jgi:hypothetical protein
LVVGIIEVSEDYLGREVGGIHLRCGHLPHDRELLPV